MHRTVIVGLLACWPFVCHAQTADPCTVRHVIVTAITEKFEPVLGLSANNFEVKIKREVLQPFDVRLAPGRRIAIVLDRSGSMSAGTVAEGQKLPIATALVQDLLRRVPLSEPIAIYSVATTVTRVAAFDVPRSELATRLQMLPAPQGRTALYDGITAAAHDLTPATVGDAIIVITDGGDNESHTAASKDVRSLARSGIRVFPVVIGSEEPSTPEEAGGPHNLQDFAEKTGGLLLAGLGPTDPRQNPAFAGAIARAVVAWINSGYDLQVRIPRDSIVREPKLRLVNTPATERLKKITYSSWIDGCEQPRADVAGAH